MAWLQDGKVKTSQAPPDSQCGGLKLEVVNTKFE